MAALFSPKVDNIQKPAKSPDCLLGVVPQPTDSRLCETRPNQPLSIAKTIATALVTSSVAYYNFPFHNITFKGITKL